MFLSTYSLKRLSERLALGSVAKSGSRWRQRLERRPGSHELENSCLACFSPSHPSPSLCQCPAAQNIDMIKETASQNGAKVTEWFPSAPPLVIIWICRALYELQSWNIFYHKILQFHLYLITGVLSQISSTINIIEKSFFLYRKWIENPKTFTLF